MTSSLEKKELAMKAEKEKVLDEVQEPEETSNEPEEQKNMGSRISASAAYHIAASAASYLHSRTMSIIPFTSPLSKSSEDSPDKCRGIYNDVNTRDSEVASFMATTDSVTAVVAAKEEVKQAVADDLNSSLSSACEWFICDDDLSRTRLFIIQVGQWLTLLILLSCLIFLSHNEIYSVGMNLYIWLPKFGFICKCFSRLLTCRGLSHLHHGKPIYYLSPFSLR